MAIRSHVHRIHTESPSKAIDDEVPARRAKIEIDYGKLKIFGCEAYTLVEKQFRNRFDNKTRKMKFVGMTNTKYKVFDPTNQKVYTRSDIKFIEADEKKQKLTIELEMKKEDTKLLEDNNHVKPSTKKEAEIEEEDKEEDKEEQENQDEAKQNVQKNIISAKQNATSEIPGLSSISNRNRNK